MRDDFRHSDHPCSGPRRMRGTHRRGRLVTESHQDHVHWRIRPAVRRDFQALVGLLVDLNASAFVAAFG